MISMNGSLRKRLVATAGLLAICLFSFFPTVAFAEDCDCFCAVRNEGALKIPDKVSADACHSKCEDTYEGSMMLICARSAAEYPSQDPWCWASASACEAAPYNGYVDTDYQPPQCLEGSFFCYPDPAKYDKYDLEVSIGDMVSVSDLGAYIGNVYRWILGSIIIIITILIMVRGAQYALSAGATDAKKAIAGIKKAIIGLVLFLSVAFILSTVNPYLLRLQVPQTPMIRQVDLVGSQSCEYLQGTMAGKDYLIVNGALSDSPYAGGNGPYMFQNATSGRKACGTVAEVVAPSNSPAVVPEGTTCTYEYCETAGERCFGNGANAKCLSCLDMIPELESEAGVNITSENCVALSPPTTVDGNQNRIQYNECFYTRDPGLIISNIEGVFSGAATIGATMFNPPLGALVAAGFATDQGMDILNGTCSLLTLECPSIQSCEDLNTDKIDVRSGAKETDQELNDLWHTGLSGSVNMQYVCGNIGSLCGNGLSCYYNSESNRCYSSKAASDLIDEINNAQALPTG